MSNTGGSGPSGRSPFPASRNPRTRGTSGSGIGLTTSTNAVSSSRMGESTTSSRGSTGVGGFHLSNNLSLSGISTAHSTFIDNATETSVSSRYPGHHQSPMFHGMLRFSPNNSAAARGGSWSPLHRGTSVTNSGRPVRNRFFESSVLRAPSNTPRSNEVDKNDEIDEATSNHPDSNDSDADKNEGDIIDGIPTDQLRHLSQQALLQSPETAVFYASILYAKTGKPLDALLLAKSHYASEQFTACLRVLDEGNLLQQEHPWAAVLVACLALQARKQWIALAEMLEDVCRVPDQSTSQNNGCGFGSSYNNTGLTFRSMVVSSSTLEDDDNVGWFQLKDFIDSAAAKHKDVVADIQSIPNQIHPLAQICYYRGQAYYEMSCMNRAVVYWKRSLQLDCQCQMAWEALLKRNLLSPGEAYDWIAHELTFRPHQEWLRSLYLARIELTPQEATSHGSALADRENAKGSAQLGAAAMSVLDASSIHMTSPIPSFLSPGGFAKGIMDDDDHRNLHGDDTDQLKEFNESPIQEEIDTAFDNLWNKHKLQEAPQVLAMAARRSFRRYEWKAALGYCEDLAQLDPAVSEAAFCYVATLVVLGFKRTLFRLAHEWVEVSPKSAQAWFAVGAYYFCIQRYHVAQRHFCRATRLDPHCTEAWIAFGCSFAACDESDQALASYRAAQRLSPGEHTSLLYMGMEYVRTNHLVLASHFLEASLTASGGDPLCLHELGVLAANKGDHKTAIQWFRRALTAVAAVSAGKTSNGTSTLHDIVDSFQDSYWEPTLFNLGHSYRKTRQFDKAALCFHRCIGLCPEKHSTYSALAFTKQLTGDLDAAISLFHQALSIKADDSFSTEMLNRALREQTMSRKQRIFDATKPTIAPLAEATNLAAKETPKAVQGVSSLSSSMLFSPNMSMISSSRLKDDRSSAMSEEMECDLDMSAAS